MTFDPGARLDPGQITDRRGMGGRGGLALGGGGLGLVVLIVYVLLGGNPGDLGGDLADPGTVTGPGGTALATDCQTGSSTSTSGSSTSSAPSSGRPAVRWPRAM